MGILEPRMGFNSVTEFMGSGLPWVISGSAVAAATSYKFDKITKHIIITNNETAADLKVGFTLNGINGVGGDYFFKVKRGETFEFDARVKEIFIMRDASTNCAFSMFAELVGIDATMMPVLTGSIDGVAFWNGIG